MTHKERAAQSYAVRTSSAAAGILGNPGHWSRADVVKVWSNEGFGKHVVLMFAQLDDYYRYITHFYPDGEHPMSGGVCLT